MKMLKGGANISQYRISGDLPGKEGIFEWAAKALSSWRFESISETTDEASIGWVTANAIDSSSFDELPPDLYFGDYLCFTLRFDQRKIPSAFLKSENQKAEKAYLREHPGTKLNKAIRKTIYDAVQKRLMKRCFPAITTTGIFWNIGTGILTLGSQSNSAIERFTDLFGRSFSGLRINAISPYERADLVAPDDLHEKLQRANRATEESYLAFVEANAWIGNGFMMWAFHNTLRGNTQFTGSCGRMNGDFTAYINKKIILVGMGSEDLQTVMLKGTQDEFTELRTALQAGKVISEATIFLVRNEMTWEVTVKGDTFHMGIKSPRIKKEKSSSADEQLAEDSFVITAGGNMEDGIALLDSLLCSFLVLRLGPSWEDLKTEIQMTINGTN